jgi:hypothetical protein
LAGHNDSWQLPVQKTKKASGSRLHFSRKLEIEVWR